MLKSKSEIEGFKSRLKQYRQAKSEDSQLNYWDYMTKLSSKKAKDWQENEDITLTQMLNDNTYNYKEFYDKDKEQAMKMLTADSEAHFTDVGKTVYHPTFSNESSYSGKVSEFNPRGTVGGSWKGEDYYVSPSQIQNNDYNYSKTRDYLNKAGGKDGKIFIPKYADGTEGIKYNPNITGEGYDSKGYYAQAMNPLPEIVVQGNKNINQSEINRTRAYIPGTNINYEKKDITPGRGALEIVSPEFDLLTGVRGIINMAVPKLNINLNDKEITKLLYDDYIQAATAHSGIKQVKKYPGYRNIGNSKQIAAKNARDAIRLGLQTKDEVKQIYKTPKMIEFEEPVNHIINRNPNVTGLNNIKKAHFDNSFNLIGGTPIDENSIPYVWWSLNKQAGKYGNRIIDIDLQETPIKLLKSDFNKDAGLTELVPFKKLQKANIYESNPYTGFWNKIKYTKSVQKNSYSDGTEGIEDKYNFISKPPKDINTDSKAFNDWSLLAATQALQRSRSSNSPSGSKYTVKQKPNISEYLPFIWSEENSIKKGYDKNQDKWFPHNSVEGGQKTIGPGIKLNGGSYKPSNKEANKGMTEDQLNSYATQLFNYNLKRVDEYLGDYNDTISPQIKMGLADIRYQVGSLANFSKLKQAIKKGDIKKIQKESKVHIEGLGQDKRRNELRKQKYFHY